MELTQNEIWAAFSLSLNGMILFCVLAIVCFFNAKYAESLGFGIAASGCFMTTVGCWAGPKQNLVGE